MDPSSTPLLIVTGLSGAGMSTTLKDLEDLGYEVFDNFPPALVEPLLKESGVVATPIAVCIDARARGFSVEAVLNLVKRFHARLLFVTADDAILQRRFTETRRRHPLAQDRPVAAGIKKEQDLVEGLRGAADVVIDTSDLSIHDLKRLLSHHFGSKEAQGLSVTLMSFGFRFGVPREADIVMDIRFLKNPHWVAELKPLTGLDAPVGAYIEQDESFAPMLENFKELLAPLLPLYAREGKSYLTIALGCTGGKHRSVYAVEKLKSWIGDQGFESQVMHRDLRR